MPVRTGPKRAGTKRTAARSAVRPARPAARRTRPQAASDRCRHRPRREVASGVQASSSVFSSAAAASGPSSGSKLGAWRLERAHKARELSIHTLRTAAHSHRAGKRSTWAGPCACAAAFFTRAHLHPHEARRPRRLRRQAWTVLEGRVQGPTRRNHRRRSDADQRSHHGRRHRPLRSSPLGEAISQLEPRTGARSSLALRTPYSHALLALRTRGHTGAAGALALAWHPGGAS